MTKTETVTSKLRIALQQVNSLPPDSGATPEHLQFVRDALTAYLKDIENGLEAISHSDLNRVSRLVIEYWPLSLPAGEVVIAAEQEMRKLAER